VFYIELRGARFVCRNTLEQNFAQLISAWHLKAEIILIFEKKLSF